MSIVDTDRIWLQSRHGIDGIDQIPRAPGLCASVVMQEDPWVVTDAERDPRTADNPLSVVTSASGSTSGSRCALTTATTSARSR